MLYGDHALHNELPELLKTRIIVYVLLFRLLNLVMTEALEKILISPHAHHRGIDEKLIYPKHIFFGKLIS